MKSSTTEELFGATNVSAWKRRFDRGEVPSLFQLADIIEANKDVALPPWLIKHLCNRLRNPDKTKKGRPPSKKSTTDMFAVCMYQVELARLQAERKSSLASGKKRARSDPPPNEIAAGLVQRTFYKSKTWRSVLNMMASRNARSRK
jgi:hypothetical protein